MIRQPAHLDQRDWITKLLVIEFRINSARAGTTGFLPFELNYGRNPSPMIWKGRGMFPGVREFAEQMRLAIMGAHCESIIAVRIVNTVEAKREQGLVDYKVEDIVCLLTKDISLPRMGTGIGSVVHGSVQDIKGAEGVGKLIQAGFERGINQVRNVYVDRRIIEAIVSHHGKSIRGKIKVLWNVDDRWAPY